MVDRDDVIHWIKRALNQLRVATVVLYLVVILVGAYVYWNAQQNHDALCQLRGDLENRVEQTQTFLDNPKDFPQFSDPNVVALIRQQVEGQQRTIDALSGLSCS